MQVDMMFFEAMILSGGRGKRLRPVTDTIPKSLILINKRPLIEWKINYLKNLGLMMSSFVVVIKQERLKTILIKKIILAVK